MTDSITVSTVASTLSSIVNLTLAGTYVGTSPTNLDYNFNSGSWTTVAPTLTPGSPNVWQFVIAAPLTPGLAYIEVRETAAPTVLAISNPFSILSAISVIVEDGTNVANSNSYVNVAAVDAYAAQTPEQSATWLALDPSAKAEALIRAAYYLEKRYRWYGLTKNSSQSMQWPRTKNFDSHGQLITPGTIPNELKVALLYLTVVAGPDPTLLDVQIDNTIPLKALALGSLKLDFVGPNDVSETAGTGTRYPEVEFLLRSIGKPRDLTDLNQYITQGLY